MVGKQDKPPQLNIFDTPLDMFINLEHKRQSPQRC
jgi:hypothetical protein